MTEQTPTSGPHSDEIPAHAYAKPREVIISVSTDELANYPAGTTVIIDEERHELIKRVQIADGTRVMLARVPATYGGEWQERAVEVARQDHAEPLWQVAVYEQA